MASKGAEAPSGWAVVPIGVLLIIGMLAIGVEPTGDVVTTAAPATASPTPTPSPSPSPSPSPEPWLTVVAEHDPPAEIRFRPGEHAGYQFGETGEVVDETSLELDAESAALADAEMIDREGQRFFRMVSGAFDGYFVPTSELVFRPEPSPTAS